MSDIANPPDLKMVHRPELDTIARAARDTRRRARLTLGDMAQLLRCSVGHVSMAEHAYEAFTDDELRTIAALHLRTL